MSGKIQFIVAVDDSDCAARAAEFAAHETVLRDGTLLLVHVVDWSGYEVLAVRDLETQHCEKETAITKVQEEIMAPLVERLAAEGLKVETRVEFGHTAEAILNVAKKTGASQIFVGRHAGSHATERFLGSLPTNLARLSPIPVTVVP